MRVGTWNLAGRWTRAHRDLLSKASCDVWLLTEVRGDVALEGYARHLTGALMAEPSRHWVPHRVDGIQGPPLIGG